MSANTPLDDLRQEIDAIDNAIQDLIIARSKVVEQVREAKRGQNIKIRPARECSIIYRLMERHTGPFPKRELARIWRELIVANLSFEGPFSVGVHIPTESKVNDFHHKRQNDFCNMIRDQYGSFTPMSSYTDATKLINDVRNHKVAIGVLAMPTKQERNAWWPLLASNSNDTLKIINRLPFIGVPKDYTPNVDALVICPVQPEPTGRDHTFLVIETAEELGLKKISAALEHAKIEPVFTTNWEEPSSKSRYLYLVEATGFITNEDNKLLRLGKILGQNTSLIWTIGTYGQPLEI